MRIPLFILLLMCFVSCETKNSQIHVGTDCIGNNLFVETFQSYSGGVYAGDEFEIFLTDSTYFRERLGDYDDHEWPDIVKVNNQVRIKWRDSHFLRLRRHCVNITELRNAGYDDLLNTKYKTHSYKSKQ